MLVPMNSADAEALGFEIAAALFPPITPLTGEQRERSAREAGACMSGAGRGLGAGSTAGAAHLQYKSAKQ